MASSSTIPIVTSRRGLLASQVRSEARVWLRLLVWWPLWILVAGFVLALVLANQSPRNVQVDIGNPSDEAYVRNFHTRLEEQGRTYRWSDVYGYIVLPGLGGGRPFTVTLEIDTGRAAPVQMFVNGEEFFNDHLDASWREVTLVADSSHPGALQSRDTVIELRSEDFRAEDNRAEPKGVKVDRVILMQAADVGFIAPALAPLILLTVSLICLYLLVGRTLFGSASEARWRYIALGVATLCALVLVLFFANDRIAVAAASATLAIGCATALILSVATEIALITVRTTPGSFTSGSARLAGVAFALAFLVRFGGMALPQAVIIDMPWHMKWLTTLLAGDWRALYFPGGLSSVPREWGVELLIPKSPLFYFAFSPLGALPFDLETSVKWLICLLDASLVLVAFWLARRVGLSAATSGLAALLYAFIPLAYRAFAYGILPTIFAQWLAALLLVLVLWLSGRKWGWLTWIGAVLLATLVLLSFPTIALFVAMVVAAYSVLLALRKQPAEPRRLTHSIRWILVLAVAGVISLVAYYGLYAEAVVASAVALVAPRAGQETARWPGGWAELVAWTSDYVVTLLPILLAAFGLVLLWVARRRSVPATQALLLLTLWVAIAPLFFVANYRVDMIGKHLFFTMLPITVLGGALLGRLVRRNTPGALFVGLVLTSIAWQGLVFWLDRLVRASS